MPHWDQKLANHNYTVILRGMLASFIGLATFFSIGCTEEESIKKVVWNLSKGRNISCLSGGKWTSPERPLYYIDGDRNLRLSVILDDSRRFEFDSVSDVYVDSSDAKIAKVKVASFGYSKQEAIERLKAMHDSWGGQGTGNIDKWIKDTEKNGGLRRHNSIIQNSHDADDPTIIVSILFNFGGSNNAWYVKTTFSWPDLHHDQLDSVETLHENK